MPQNPNNQLNQIKTAAPLKPTVVRPSNSNLTNHRNKKRKICRRRKGEPINGVLLRTPAHDHNSVGRLTKNYIHQLYADNGCILENLSRVMADREGGKYRIKETVL